MSLTWFIPNTVINDTVCLDPLWGTPGIVLALLDIFKMFSQLQPKTCPTTCTVSAIMDYIWLTYLVLNYISISLKVLLIAFLVLVVWIQLIHSKVKQEIRDTMVKSSTFSKLLSEKTFKHKLTHL